MDPVGFAVGVVALAPLVAICVRSFQAVKLEEEHGVLDAQLTVQRDRFYQWAQNSGLLKRQTVDGRLFDRRVDEIIHRTIRKVKILLEEISELVPGSSQATTAKQKRRRSSNVRLSRTRGSSLTGGLSTGGQEDLEAWETTDNESGDYYNYRSRRLQAPAQNRATLTSAERVKEFQDLISQLTYYIDRLEKITEKGYSRRRAQAEVDITELAIEDPSSGSLTNRGVVEDAPPRSTTTAQDLRSWVEEYDRQLDVEGGQPPQPMPSFAQRIHESVREEIRSRPVSVSIASVASVTGVVSLVRTFG